MQKILTYLLQSQAIIYGFRVILGFLIGYYLYLRLPAYEPFWCLLSIILVISPEGKDSVRLSVERFKSNLIGSGVGLICLQFDEVNWAIMLFGIVLTVIVCSLFRVMNMARVAIVALIIVLIQPHTSQTELAPILRFVSVASGCFIGLFVILSTSVLLKRLRKLYQISDNESIV